MGPRGLADPFSIRSTGPRLSITMTITVTITIVKTITIGKLRRVIVVSLHIHSSTTESFRADLQFILFFHFPLQREHLKFAQQYFQLVGGSASECGEYIYLSHNTSESSTHTHTFADNVTLQTLQFQHFTDYF